MTTFGIFAKYPVPGGVKTRLAERVGAERAAAIHAAFLRESVRRFSGVAERGVLGWTEGTAAATAAEDFFRTLAGDDYHLWRQPDVGLGERMQAFFRQHLDDLPPRQASHRAVLIGSDSPTLPREYVRRAFRLLERVDCVLGPAADGGYYLIGMRERCQPVFEGVAWSSHQVLSQTVSLCRQQRVSLGLLPVWYDVDTWADWELLRGHVAGLGQSGKRSVGRELWRFLNGDVDSGADVG